MKEVWLLGTPKLDWNSESWRATWQAPGAKCFSLSEPSQHYYHPHSTEQETELQCGHVIAHSHKLSSVKTST